LLCQCQGMRTAQPSTGAGHNGDTIGE